MPQIYTKDEIDVLFADLKSLIQKKLMFEIDSVHEEAKRLFNECVSNHNKNVYRIDEITIAKLERLEADKKQHSNTVSPYAR